MSRSHANGHFHGRIRLDAKELVSVLDDTWLTFEAVVPEGDERRFSGRCQVLPPKGIAVVSDIDDTIKDSNVLDKKELLANTFLRPFRAVSGMADPLADTRGQLCPALPGCRRSLQLRPT